MVRETRHLWVGNLPDNIREERIREHFKRYGRVQSVKLLARGCGGKEETGESTMACTVAFMDIKSASKAHNVEHKIDDRTLTTEYYEPAAIPSAASPQNTPSSYSTSPGNTRFPNGHGSTEELTNFNERERFYDRTNNRVIDEFIARRSTNYHENSRGRNRDRTYRNGPYNNATVDRTHRTINNSWTSYDATRYNSQNETGYVSAPSETTERRSSEHSTKKKTKSRSGSRSPSPSGSTSSRSPSRSRSRSSSSSSSSSTSRDTSSTGSPKSRRVHSLFYTEDRRPLAICVRNLPIRSSDTSLKDGLFHEYKKHGKVTWVKMMGQSLERYAIVCFKKPQDVEKALEVSYDKLFFGCKIVVAPYQGYDEIYMEETDFRPYEAEIDEFHPKATRTLFIGNLEKDVTASDLRKHFDQFGEIIEIDIKKQGAVGSYAFCQYSDIMSVVQAIRKMDGEHLGNNRIKLGFGKSMPTNCVWVDGIAENVTEKYLKIQFESYGTINKVNMDRDKGQALIFYDQVLSAQSAVTKMRGFTLKNSKIQVDFASRECQESFFEHLDKQGTIIDRTVFEERRDSTSRSFDSTSNRFPRHDTPTRPRTSSYSSRSSVAASQVASAIPSPGTPGSVTPRGTSSRSRVARFEYYDQSEYGDRHFLNSYDEYSQGSGASHDEVYEHEYGYNHDSPSNLETLDSRTLQSVTSEPVITFPPPDIRNLQKERVHLLEQLEECPSSGDELLSPKKRLKLESLDISLASEVIIEANRDHRKVMEVRRLSDVNIKHHSRRPSIDSKHSRELGHERTSYLPHAVCKRRKTTSSDGGSRVHHYDHSGSESVGGSRPGTPLCDERPENFTPSEPRRTPREREGPLTLPLPRFAAQIMNRGSVSVAGIKGQRDNILSSPPPAVTSPRISNPRPPSPVPVPPPASPPPRPPSLSSNSSDSDVTPPSPSLDERIRSLDEKYEKWSGSRALSAAGGDALAKLDATRERFRKRHNLLDLDLKEVQPSEIVKSVLAKRSVFDEDSKRLENVGEKYEPKEFSLLPRGNVVVPQATVPATPLSAPPTLKVTTTQLPKTPTMLSPRSASTIIPAKGLQYPFPSHPPMQQTVPSPLAVTSTTTTSTTSTSLLTTSSSTTSTTTRGSSHGDNRLKLCASVSSDNNRTSSKVTVNRSALGSNLPTTAKTNEKNNIANIPNTSEVSSASVDVQQSGGKGVRDVKFTDKNSDKITCRRDSNSSSPRGDIKTRRNSDTSARKIDEIEKYSEHNTSESNKTEDKHKEETKKKEQQKQEKIRLEKEKLEREKLEKEKLERERIERERLEKEQAEKEEKERLSKEKQEKERLEQEKLERERQEQEKIERDRRKEKEDRERKEREERERREKEEKERLEREEKERREREEKERLEREKIEKENREREERERKEHEREEKERREREERLEKEKQDRERKEKERLEKEQKDEEERLKRLEKERLEKERLEKINKDADKKDDSKKQKDDNHEKRKDEHGKSRENHSEKHRENNLDSRNTKDNKEDKCSREEMFKKDVLESRSTHDKNSEKHKTISKENNLHKNLANEIREGKDRPSIESRHMSIDFDKTKHSDGNLNKSDPTKRKERNNSLPANIGSKRRMSSHDSIEDDSKRMKLNQDHKKISERRDSKDSNRSDEKTKSKHKNNSYNKVHEDKVRSDKHNNTKDKEERYKNKLQKFEKQKQKMKNREKDGSRESPNAPKSPAKDLPSINSLDFLSSLDLCATEELERQKQQHRKELKEKKKSSEISDAEEFKDDKKCDDRIIKKERHSMDKSKREELPKCSSDERKLIKKDRMRKMTNSSDNTDSDEPKKHSIFDIVDDEPAYISMYDKVKARSCKNMQKQEEEKRQEKIKAKFCQLKQSRAKREEKKRSTSWDEDSDSDREKCDMKSKRISKLLASSDDDDQIIKKGLKKRDMYADSDLERQIKQEIETSDDDRIKTKTHHSKGSKSRITSDTSDDEFKKIQAQMKTEIFSDNEVDQGFADSEEKPYIKSKELEKVIKKEHRIKHQDSLVDQINAQIFGDSSSPLPEIKSEKYNNKHFENSSADESIEIKKERSELRKKHKKKQKRQKHSLSSEESGKLESVVDTVQYDNIEKVKHHDKKKQHSKKDKKRDKSKDEREKSRKSKKNKSDTKCDSKRDGKMENIFGSLSEDSENGIHKDTEQSNTESSSYMWTNHDRFNKQTSNYVSDTDGEQDKLKQEGKERDSKEEHRKRKEKKRREKERRLQEAAAASEQNNENSMDYSDMAKQLEANIKDDSVDATELNNKCDIESSVNDNDIEDTFRFNKTDFNEFSKKDDKKESREKKKKRKKSKEEKQKHHHHHHHDKNKLKSPEARKESSPIKEIKIEVSEPDSLATTTTTSTTQALPTLLDMPATQQNKSPNLDYSISPVSREPLISPIPNTPTTSKDKRRDKFIPGFGGEIDENIHENAVKSISDFETPKPQPVSPTTEKPKTEKVAEPTEEKPRVIISQEETEDAVAALLGESFGHDQFEDCYNEEDISSTNDQSTTLPEENTPQDDEEMRQAVQSLSANDLDVKPDTPQSEHELQIDTDTEEQEELSLRFDQPPKTPDIADLSKPPKTPDIPSFYQTEIQKSSVILKSTNLSSPPSLTPIKQSANVELEKKPEIASKPLALNLPPLTEQIPTSVISKPTWSLDKDKKIEPIINKLIEPPIIKLEDKLAPTSVAAPTIVNKAIVTKTNTNPPLRTYSASPILKLNDQYPPLTALTKDHQQLSPRIDQKLQPLPALQAVSRVSPIPFLHNLPARSPVQQKTPISSSQESTLIMSTKQPPNPLPNRLPITPVMVSRAQQPATILLPQPKIAHSLEIAKSMPSVNTKLQERPRLVYQKAALHQQVPPYIPPQPRTIVQPVQRCTNPQNLLVPNSYNFISNLPPYGLSPISKANISQTSNIAVVSPSLKVPSTVAPTTSSSTINTQSISAPENIIKTPHPEHKLEVPSPTVPFSQVIQELQPKATISPIICSTNKPEPLLDVVTIKKEETDPNIDLSPPKETNTSADNKVKSEITKSTPSPVIKSIFSDKSEQKETTPQVEKVIEETKSVPQLAIEKVTEELNQSLKRDAIEIKQEKEIIEAEISAIKSEVVLKKEVEDSRSFANFVENKPSVSEFENTPTVKEIDKFDEEKAETESVISDLSKERSSAEILSKDDPLDSKEDSDYWSAKEVNIDSVIKTLCSADELSDHSSEVGKDEWFDTDSKLDNTDIKLDNQQCKDNKDAVPSKTDGQVKEEVCVKDESDSTIMDNSSEEVNTKDDVESSKSDDPNSADDIADSSGEKETSIRGGRRGGRARGRKGRGGIERGGVQTRRAKIVKEVTIPVKRGGIRGGKSGKLERKSSKSESEATADVYEFHDDSDENNPNKERPRLILTIKSPSIANPQPPVIKELGKESSPPAPAKTAAETKEEFLSPVNTRKSRRLQEKDGSRNTVDDTIEDVVRNKNIAKEAAAATGQGGAIVTRRSARQSVTNKTPPQETPRKSPRGGRKKDRRGSETNDDSSEEKSVKSEPLEKSEVEPIQKEVEKTKTPEAIKIEDPTKVEPPKEKPHEGLKAAVLRRVKGELHQEPTSLIDPVTGLLIPMRECEEGRYIPVPGEQRPIVSNPLVIQSKPIEPVLPNSVISSHQAQLQLSQPQQPTVVVPKQKPQSLKAHVLSSQAAKSVVVHQPQQPVQALKTNPVVTQTPHPMQQSIIVTKPNTPISQHINVNNYQPNSPLRQNMAVAIASKPVINVKPPKLSPHQIPLINQQKQVLQVKPQSMVSKAHMVTTQQMVNAQMAHMKQQSALVKQQVLSKVPAKPIHSVHPQQILTAAVASPPLSKTQSQQPIGANPSRILPTSAKCAMEPPPKIDISLSNVMLAPRSTLSPQGQPRHIQQAGMTVPAYEASLHGERSLYNRSRSPPPAHQNSPSPQGETISHFPPGSVPLRAPHDLPPAHYLHPPHVMQYQQYLRQQPYSLPRSPMVSTGIEKSSEGPEGEEAPVNSPPLELRRPGSVGHALTGRVTVVPHSLHSPQDRTTDSPQIYNMHSSRMQHYHAGRFYEQTAEPPPAHRPLTSHGSLAALGSERALTHMGPLGTPDRPHSGHLQPDRPLSSHSALATHISGMSTPERPLSTHLPPERPLSNHGLALGAGLGAAGNLMGAVARHVGVDAPATQRGLQAATPPHASQVPPQAESLFMLLKQYPCMWQGLLALKNDQAAVQMYFVSGNDQVAKCTLPKNSDGSTPPLRIFQRMRLEPPQVEGVARKMQMENEHCMLLALPCGHDHMDVLKQSTNLTNGFITYLQQKQAAGIINVAAPGTTQPPAYVVHIFPSCDFVNENLRRIAPSLLERVADIAHLLIVITTV